MPNPGQRRQSPRMQEAMQLQPVNAARVTVASTALVLEESAALGTAGLSDAVQAQINVLDSRIAALEP